MVKVRDIGIRAFRGIGDLDLELGGRNLLLKGENGTGKSSIVEALEFFFTGDISTFRGKGTQRISLKQHAHHVYYDPEDMEVELTLNPGAVSLKRTLGDSPSPPQEFLPYFNEAEEETFVLRRNQILEFVFSRPADRFRAIASILGITDLDEIELEFMGVCDYLEGEISSKEKQKEKPIKEISDQLGARITQSEDILKLLNEKLRGAEMPEISDFDKVDAYYQERLKMLRSSKDLDKYLALRGLSGEVKKPFFSDQLQKNVCGLHEKAKLLLRNQEKVRKISRIKLLEEGRDIVKKTDQDICPLCCQRINRKKLFENIQMRLKTLNALSKEASEIRKNSKEVEESLKERVEKLGMLIDKLKDVSELKEERKELSEEKGFLKEFIGKIKLASNLEEELPVQKFEDISSKVDDTLRPLPAKSKQLLEKIPLTNEEKRALKFIQLITKIKTETYRLKELEKEIEEIRELYSRAKKVYSAFKESKNSKLSDLYQSIKEDVNHFYSTLHPGENHKNIELVPVRRASTELSMKSFGKAGEHPRAYASEGHLDSLGLCIFLAFVKKFNEECNLVVLDDVVTTIDSSHREMICGLLLEEFSDRQLVITTHDNVWYEQLCRYQRSYGMEGDFVNKEIVRWNVETGPVFKKYTPRSKKIQEKLDSGYKRGAGNECRRYLEWLLNEVCEHMEAKTPHRRSGRYSISDLFNPARSRLKKKIKDEDFRDKVDQAFGDIEKTKFMSNLLSHDNPEIGSLSTAEIERLGERIKRLHNLLSCSSCESLLTYSREFQIIRCSRSNCENPTEIKTK